VTRVNRIKRRQLLKMAAAGSVAYAFGRLPEAVHAQVVGADAPFADYKALVCVFLFGGNDSWNMLVPRSAAEYAEYARSRQNLALPQENLLPIDPRLPDPQGGQFGLHPSMPEIAALFGQDEACAIVANVGPLIVPTTKQQYQSHAVPLPPQLFSHNDQQDQWHALRGRAVSTTGWAGRVADALAGQAGQPIALNISLAGQTLFQAGANSLAYAMGPGGPVGFAGMNAQDAYSLARRGSFENVLGAAYDTVYERSFSQVQQRALGAAAGINAALAQVRAPSAPAFSTVFPTSPLGTQLRTVAEMIAVRDSLQASRQIFFVAAGGFDTHDDQSQDQPALLANVSQCMNALYRASVEMGIASSVTAFTQSDFGRTLTSNGDGTDHAWGGIQLVIGGAVRGRTIYGRYPLLRIGGADDVGGGRMIPGISSDQYAATLARWFGVAEGDLASVTPSLVNFTQRDLGFMV
jgi:uncharacterized protein (DUF1501 family)